ncbi:MAG: dihydroorotate dehydrogenase-like protein [Calditrichaeota bacterium]|nr:MAG: dihydroorotate dehydrogenase-like protein [Calditrichota bacterium]
MDLKTSYMGFELKNPLVASASPLSASVDTIKELEDMGIAAVVMYSLFEEQIQRDAHEIDHFLTTFSESYAEALSYFPEPEEFHNMEAEEYLDQIRKLKEAVDIPVIGSLNGVSPGGWIKFAQKMEEAGADALELNVYYIPTDPKLTSQEVEQIYLDDLKAVKSAVNIPVAMKLSPYFSSFANMAHRLDKAGADALVLFNRFYQPDIDLETLEVVPQIHLSNSHEIQLPLRWIAILYGTIEASLAATSGVHTADDVLKLVMAGADVTMMASVLLKEGPRAVSRILENLQNWMEEHEYESISQMKGSMSYQAVAEPAALVRANYIKTLQSVR